MGCLVSEGDQTDGVGASLELEFGYEDDFEDYVESESDEVDGSDIDMVIFLFQKN